MATKKKAKQNRDRLFTARMNAVEWKRLEEVADYLALGQSSAVRYLINKAHQAIKRGRGEATL